MRDFGLSRSRRAMAKAVAEEKDDFKDGEDWPADSNGVADDEVT